MDSFSIFAILTLALSYLGYYLTKRNSKYPPGPRGLPYFGSLFSLGGAPHLKYSEWAKKYGPVFSVKLGIVNAVVLNDSIRDAFKEESYTGRPDNKFFLQFSGGKKAGVVGSDAHTWTEQRRFALKGLGDFGVGKNSMENIIMDEVDEFVEKLKKETGHPISLNRKFSLAILNSIWMITCGKRYKHDDLRLSSVLDKGVRIYNSYNQVESLLEISAKREKFKLWFDNLGASTESYKFTLECGNQLLWAHDSCISSTVVVNICSEIFSRTPLETYISPSIFNLFSNNCGSLPFIRTRCLSLVKLAESVLNESVKSGLLIFLLELISIAPEITGWNRVAKATNDLFDVMKEQIQEHEESFVTTNRPRDFTETYLANIKATTDPKSSFYKDNIPYSDEQLEAVMVDLFFAGSQTASTTLTWAILYLATNPKVQKKMQNEIHQVVGKNIKPSLADKTRLPYTEAVIQEVLRMSSIVPSGVFHSTMKEIVFQGFEIPKDTYIISNLHGVLHDPDIWDEPDSFRPERFLSDDGKTLIKHEAFIPFSTGKRACIGETLARDETFLFLTNIIQRFQISTERPINEVSTDPSLGFLLEAQHLNVILKDVL